MQERRDVANRLWQRNLTGSDQHREEKYAGRRRVEPLVGEAEQEPERVAVRADCVRARLALLEQALGEEALQ